MTCSQTIETKSSREMGHLCFTTLHTPAVRLTTEAVPAVIASTWEWISCFDSSILFLRQALDA